MASEPRRWIAKGDGWWETEDGIPLSLRNHPAVDDIVSIDGRNEQVGSCETKKMFGENIVNVVFHRHDNNPREYRSFDFYPDKRSDEQ